MNIKKVGKILGGIAIGVGAVIALPVAGPVGAVSLVGALIGGGIGGVTGVVVDFFGKDSKANKLGIIGMQASGKTTFLNNLRGLEAVLNPTSRENFESFKFELSNGKTIYIDKGNDIGGAKNYMVEYRQIIEKNDIVLYFFNVSEYLTSIDYKRECNSRLDHINGNIKNKKSAIIASHSDLSQHSKNKLIEEILNQVRDKKYSNLFNNAFFVVNLTKRNEVSDLMDKIFG
ncbi:GTPase domain-containing protein [Flavobacterium frigoris]|uniref:ADP-ribosylation factor family protein n=1 Tax=Flavobacterium frigoris TaxID=229204 RepID=A0A1H9P8R3_FLAFI|nr:GTPase domain-containing protein [Flavobacterium frigoris]SER44598.1 ADP-ribosylation factor family protein [Flavobacterium frigoris]